MDESLLIISAESYLKEIEEEKIDLNKIFIFSEFKSIYSIFNNRLKKLQELKIDMESKGYTAPNRSLMKYSITTYKDPGYEELSENSKQNQFFRTKASSKKNIYNRVKSAIDSHKIAIGHLQEFAFLKCDACNKTYKVSDFFKNNNNKKCSCKSEEFSIEIAKNGVSRIEIINYLPLSGNYMVLLSMLNNWGRESFKKVSKYLKQEKNSVVKAVSAAIKFKKNDRWIRKKISLDSQYSDNYEEKIRQDYGKNVRFEALQFNRLKPSIINEKHTRYALALAYAGYCQELIEENKQDILNKYIKNLKTLKEYDKIIVDVSANKPKFFDEFDTVDEWRESEIEKNLKTKGLMDKKGNINPVLSKDIKVRTKLEKNIFTQIAPTLILWDIFKFYITKSKDVRRRYTSPFPYLRDGIDRKQREIFTLTNNEAINILKKYSNENIAQIKNMDFILHKKFKLENIKGVRMNQVALGGAIINLYTDLDVPTISKIFSITEKSIEKEIKNIKLIAKPKTQKSKDFLKLIKN